MLDKIIKLTTIFILLFFLVSCSNNNITLDFPVQEEEGESIIVEIKGAIKIPGIYSFDKGVMLFEIINSAGGLLNNADKDNINMIQIYNNNASINIPFLSTNSNNQTLININKASISELMLLSGIGEAKAQAIIEYRSQNAFNCIEDIMKVSGISDAVFNKIKGQITV